MSWTGSTGSSAADRMADDCAFKAVCPADSPPVLLFDLGNVLVRLRPVDLLWPDSRPEPGTLPYAERWRRSRAVREYETGRIGSLAEFYRAASREMGFQVSETQFVRVFHQIIGEPFPETIPLLSALRENYPLALLSNTSREHWLYCRDELGLGGFFRQEFLSYQMGAMKPDPQIFRRMLTQIGVAAEAVCYFDDQAENVAAAREFGIRAFRSHGGPALVGLLRDLRFIE